VSLDDPAAFGARLQEAAAQSFLDKTQKPFDAPAIEVDFRAVSTASFRACSSMNCATYAVGARSAAERACRSRQAARRRTLFPCG
jgi:hypothetical protein